MSTTHQALFHRCARLPASAPSTIAPAYRPHLPSLLPRHSLTMSRRATASQEDLRTHSADRSVASFHRDAPISLREAMRLANAGETKHTQVPYGSLDRAFYPPAVTPAPVGRRTLISAVKALKLRDAIVLYQDRGFNITKQHLREAVAGIIEDMPEAERSAWNHDQPCETWARDVFQRPGPLFLAENRLGAASARATTRENNGKQSAILSHLIVPHRIFPDCLSNWDESGFSVEKITSGQAKTLMCKDIGRSLTRGVPVGADAPHITVGAAISETGHAYSPIVVLPGAQASDRVLNDGRTETPDDSRLRGAIIFHRTPAGVDWDIMLDWARSCLKETEELRRTGKTMVIFDGYASHLS